MSESQSFESIGKFVQESLVFGQPVERKLSICPIFVLIAREVHESIEPSTPLLNIHGILCDTCVVVFIVAKLLVGIIEHSLHTQSKSWLKYSIVVGPKRSTSALLE